MKRITKISTVVFSFVALNSLYALKLPSHSGGHSIHKPDSVLHSAIRKISPDLDVSSLSIGELSALERLATDIKDPAQREAEIGNYLKGLKKVRDANKAVRSWVPSDYARKVVSKATAKPGDNDGFDGLETAAAGAAGMAFKRPDHTGKAVEAGGAPTIRNSEFTDKLVNNGILTKAEADALYTEFFGSNGSHRDVPEAQARIAIQLLILKKLRKEPVSADDLRTELATVAKEGLGAAEARKLNQLRDAIDADPAIQKLVNEAIAKGGKDPAKVADSLSALVDAKAAEALKSLPADVQASYKEKVAAAKSAIDAYKADPSAENLARAREAAEEIVATADKRFRDICSVCDCR